jgi:hypothetical protein
MTYNDIPLNVLPAKGAFLDMMNDEWPRWETYQPKEAAFMETPLLNNWPAILYWLGKYKDKLYEAVIREGYTGAERILYDELGIDPAFMHKYFTDLMKNLRWASRNNKENVLGETL